MPAHRHGPAIELDEATETASTGDVWLFRGRSLADRTIQTVTNSPVNHVGMVVALDDLPPLLWHAELGRSLPDVWTGERQRGVQLHLLRDAVTTWETKYGQRAWVRRLLGDVERHHEDRLVQTIDRFDGRPFPPSAGRLLARWAGARVRRTPSGLETVYCAELVATTMQGMGLLPRERPASWYDPGRFWSGDRIDLVPPFALDGEIAVLPQRAEGAPDAGRAPRRTARAARDRGRTCLRRARGGVAAARDRVREGARDA